MRSSRPGHTVEAMPRADGAVIDRRAAFGEHSCGGQRRERVANLEAARERQGQRDARAGIIGDGCECKAAIV